LKLSTPQSTKFMKLKRRLSLTHWQCVGLLESVWLFTQLNAPAGDIGRHPNEDIAAAIEWGGNHDDLITALIECGFIDECDVSRLVIHDWYDHAPTYLKGAMAKHGKEFCRPVKKAAKQPAKQGARGGHGVGRTPPKQPAPNQTKPNQTEPSEATSLPADAGPLPTAKARPRNELFDSIAEVCALDPATARAMIGKVSATLTSAAPPYTADDVRHFARRFHEFCSWAARESPPRMRPTAGEVQKYIGGIRAAPPPAPPPKPPGGFKTKQQQQSDTYARLADFLEESERAALNAPGDQL